MEDGVCELFFAISGNNFNFTVSRKEIAIVPEVKEATIIELLEAGDERCMKMMFDAYYQTLCTYVMRYLISVEDAEDIVQSVFISLWNNKRGQAFTGSVRSYLFGAVSKASLQFMRNRGKAYFVDIELHIDDFLEEICMLLLMICPRIRERCLRRLFLIIFLIRLLPRRWGSR